jgi:hypothetical protein
MNSKELNIGKNSKGVARLWIEGAFIENAGFKAGERAHIEMVGNSMVITASATGKKKISGKPGRPILDMTGKTVTQLGQAGDRVQITITQPGTLLINKL